LIVLSGWPAWAHADSLADAKAAATVHLGLRSRVETKQGSQRYHTVTRTEDWPAHNTAIIVCDMWDLHHCLNAVRRETEFAPRLERVLQEARRRGVTIIHAPSECMDAYQSHPARRHAMSVPLAKDLPPEIGTWCSRIPAEERGRYPVDQSDGGEDDDLAEHRVWAQKLSALGRNPKAPWKQETDLLTIDPNDYVSDKGDEVWSILQHLGINRVILTGVHTNMCVLGRPFGLRQMARNGKRVVLVRDLTDTMYNPERWPFVSHFSGTDLIVEHIEKFVCPTITSDQLIGGPAFRFHNDTRPHLVMLVGEDEYNTAATLPAFATEHLNRDFRVSTVFASETNPHDFPGLDVLDDADVLLISVRRRGLAPKQMAALRRYVNSGKPVVGIRTASHAFSPAKEVIEAGYAAWPEFDREVFGGNYHGHYGKKDIDNPRTQVRAAPEGEQSTLLAGLRTSGFSVTSWLYKTSPLAAGTSVLLMGQVADRQPSEPVAWTFIRRDGARSFYTSLGHPEEFKMAEFQRLLATGIHWAAGLPISKETPSGPGKAAHREEKKPTPTSGK
jgi:nicotinamidase-related amidase/type 1 glutamine amidotransferase